MQNLLVVKLQLRKQPVEVYLDLKQEIRMTLVQLNILLKQRSNNFMLSVLSKEILQSIEGTVPFLAQR